MAAAKATLETILDEDVLENCQKTGAYFLAKLQALKAKHVIIAGVRGRGLMLACALTVEGADLVKKCQEKGLLINCTGGKTLRFVPPLIITEKDIDMAIAILDEVMEGR
ncbi:MAG: aspartate aminotransferase family protein, partial [Deltaproteobacteria bacterium HGW-Deltaproteobacteria-9]